MSIQKRLLLAVFVASQLPAHLIAGPLPITGGAHAVGTACIGHDINAGCEAWPARVVSDELVGSHIKRVDVPIIPDSPELDPESEPLVGLDPGTDSADPVGGDLEPIVVDPEPQAPPQAPPRAPSVQPDDANQPQGDLKGNDPGFNGYAVVGPSKAVTKLNDAISTNKDDVPVVKFDEEVEDPAHPGEKFTKYQKPLITPSAGTNGAPRYDVPSAVVLTKDAEFQDPDVGLPVKRIKPNGFVDPGALYQSIKIRSTKNKEGEFDPFNKDVVVMGANKDGTAIVVEVTDAAQDFNKAAGDKVPDNLKKTPSSDLIFAGAALARAPGRPASNLRVIMRRAVINKGVINTFREAYERNGLSDDKKAVFRASAAKDTPEGQAFDALMKTKNFEVSNFLLADHHQAIGNKVIQKIVAFPDKTFPDTTNENASANIYLILGKQ